MMYERLGGLQEDGIMYEILETREDGSFVILKDGLPFHACQEYAPEIWAAVKAQIEGEK